MAKFEHHRYPALSLQGSDDVRPYAVFTPEAREFGEHTIKVGVLETDDEDTVSRLRAAIAAGGDEHLKEIDAPAPAPEVEDYDEGDDLSGLDKDQLLAVAEAEGVTVDKRLGADKLADAIRDHRNA
ncbi:hypothetical protein [Amycolatopsis sp. NPDC001319]|uniref:hypothetical protein n=1 Tax=unclassified Amycolatopsis TaxID=2618356 RepID=UPI0036AA021A